MANCWKRAVPLAFHLCCFYFSAILIVGVTFPIYLSIDINSSEEDCRAGAQRHRAEKKKENSKKGKIKKLKVMLQKRLKTVKNKRCGLGHAMWYCPYRFPKRLKVLEDRDIMGKSI